MLRAQLLLGCIKIKERPAIGFKPKVIFLPYLVLLMHIPICKRLDTCFTNVKKTSHIFGWTKFLSVKYPEYNLFSGISSKPIYIRWIRTSSQS